MAEFDCIFLQGSLPHFLWNRGSGGGDSRFGTTWTADMATGYVGIGYGDSGMTQQVPDEVKAAVEELAAKIASGEIVVETTRA